MVYIQECKLKRIQLKIGSRSNVLLTARPISNYGIMRGLDVQNIVRYKQNLLVANVHFKTFTYGTNLATSVDAV